MVQIKCVYPYNDGDPSSTDQLVNLLVRKIKFTDFKPLGEELAKTKRDTGTAVLVIDVDNCIKVKSKYNLGDLLLGDVGDCLDQLRVVGWLSVDIKRCLKIGFEREMAGK